MFVRKFVRGCESVCECVVYVYVYAYIDVCMYVYVYVSVCVCVYVYVYVSIFCVCVRRVRVLVRRILTTLRSPQSSSPRARPLPQSRQRTSNNFAAVLTRSTSVS